MPLPDLPELEPYLLLPAPSGNGMTFLGKERSAYYDSQIGLLIVRLRAKAAVSFRLGYCADVEAAKRICEAWVLRGEVHEDFKEIL